MSQVKLEGLYLKNFRSIQELDWDLTSVESGLIFVSGDNRVEPSLGANGAGKSSIFEGMVWTLYGQNSRNIKTPTLVTWGESKRSVIGRVKLSIDNEPIQIERTAQTAGLRIFQHGEWRTVVQTDVNNLLGLDFNSFIWLVYIPQFGIRFFDLTPTEKLNLFTSIMEETLNKWAVFADKARDRASELTREIEQRNIELGKFSGLLQAQTTTEYRKLSSAFETDRTKKLKELNADILKEQKKFKNITKDLKVSKRDIAATKSVLEHDVKSKDKIDKARNDALVDLNKAKDLLRTCEIQIRMYEKELNTIENLEDVCPTCNQQVDSEHKAKIIKDLRTKISKEENKLNRHTALVEDKEEHFNRKRGELQAVTEEIQRYGRQTNDLELEYRTLEKDYDRCSDELEKLKGDVKALKSQRNEYEVLIQKTRDKKKLLNRVVTTMTEETQELNKELVAQNYWKKGFKDIRIMLIREALKEFESYVNMNLVSLGLENWQVTLDIESETKSGTLRRELSVFVTTTEDGEKMTVPFNVWSGGEGQRLRLAGIFGMIDFIQNYNNVEFNIEIYDEPTTWLSNAGIVNLMETLAQRASSTDRRIMVIDHRDLESLGTFDSAIAIVKDSTGTHIE
jgi:DNA repair exonuclease SbcCD ATPase subunit